MEMKEGDIESVGLLTFTENRQNTLSKEQVIVFGGNHRKLVLKKYVLKLASMRENFEKQLIKLPAEDERDAAQRVLVDEAQSGINNILIMVIIKAAL
jgi:hypothetical protein